MNINPVSSTSMIQYTRPLSPVNQVQRVPGGASSKLLKAAKNIELSEDTGKTYNRSLRESSEMGKIGRNISIIA